MSIIWIEPRNILRLGSGKPIPSADSDGNVSCSQWLPPTAKAAVLTVECGYLITPAQANAVEIRIMPFGYNKTNNVLDIHKHTVLAGGAIPAIDVTAIQVIMPFHNIAKYPNPGLQFYYALQSTDPSVSNKMAIIDLWGYM